MERVINYGFSTMLRMGQFLEMPEAVASSDLDIIYTGPMSRALQSEVSAGIIQYLMTTAEMSQFYPEMLDIPNIDAMSRKLAELNGVPTDTLHSQKEVEAVRKLRAEQQAQAAERQAILEGGDAMKAAGEGAAALKAVGGEQ